MAKETTSERLDAIERRLDRLEDRGVVPAEVPEGDQFWALNMLKGMVGEPGMVLFTGTVTPTEGEHFDWQEGKLMDQLLAQDWSELSANLAALAHPVRLSLVQDVLTGRRTASELSADGRFGTSGQLYHHLRQLVSAGWLKSTGRGHYSVPPQRVVPLLVILMGADR